MSPQLTRREFIRTASLAGGGLVVGIWFAGCNDGSDTPSTTTTSTTTTEPATPTTTTTGPEPAPEVTAAPNIYLQISSTGAVTVTAFRSEMGQGIRTAIAMVLAEELDADWESVRIEQAGADRNYGDQVTGGSASVTNHYRSLRRAGAAVRLLLLDAAASTWGVSAADCTTDAGWVLHPDGEQRLSYGDLAATAAELGTVGPAPPAALKDPADFHIIGTPQTLHDTPDHVTGRAVYTSDLSLPGMRYTAIARCPTFGGSPKTFDAAAALAVPGVTDVFEIPSGVAVVADDTWSALQGRSSLAVTWDRGRNIDIDTPSIHDDLVRRTPADAADGFTRVYDVAYQAHCPMEPPVAVADVRSDGCEVWASTQDPQDAQQVARSLTGLSLRDVTIHVPLLGGRFGRGLENDSVAEAVELSMVTGAPIKVVWTREDDLSHDFYHPVNRIHVTGTADRAPRSRLIGARNPIPTGAWRSVYEHPTAFGEESFLDEVAHETGIDPVELRLRVRPEEARAAILLAADRSGWGSPLPPGRGRGFAHHATFGVTQVAQVAEVTVVGGLVTVDRVVCAVDCGTVINPDTVKAQMQGGIAFGLTAALHGGVTLTGGAVDQSNYHDHPILTFGEMPVVEVHLVTSQAEPSGIGEMGVPPIAPAVANAIFSATGVRLRTIPLQLGGLA